MVISSWIVTPLLVAADSVRSLIACIVAFATSFPASVMWTVVEISSVTALDFTNGITNKKWAKGTYQHWFAGRKVSQMPKQKAKNIEFPSFRSLLSPSETAENTTIDRLTTTVKKEWWPACILKKRKLLRRGMGLYSNEDTWGTPHWWGGAFKKKILPHCLSPECVKCHFRFSSVVTSNTERR